MLQALATATTFKIARDFIISCTWFNDKVSDLYNTGSVVAPRSLKLVIAVQPSARLAFGFRRRNQHDLRVLSLVPASGLRFTGQGYPQIDHYHDA